jgi:hypothetical protein
LSHAHEAFSAGFKAALVRIAVCGFSTIFSLKMAGDRSFAVSSVVLPCKLASELTLMGSCKTVTVSTAELPFKVFTN